jgi:EmrB/QacA subfamily drug resistance transporter
VTETAVPMTHREVMRALSGLLLAMFVAMLSSTIVSSALPVIVLDLKGSQSGYTWVVVATLLTMTASTPVWGKLADQFDQKLLVQSALLVYSVGSLIAGFAPTMEVLIAARTIQGLGVGGLFALVQIVIAHMVTPRERGRYSGYIGVAFALATVTGPLIGGVLVDTIGWRWCFWAGLPVALAAFAVLQRTLHLPFTPRKVTIDYLGAFLIMAGISVVLVWISLGGVQFAWGSPTSLGLAAASVTLIAAAVYVEARVAAEPIIPLRLFADRTTLLSTIASGLIGVALMGGTVYLQMYFQLSRGMSPTKAGLMSICMVGGMMVTSVISGRAITRTGRWKGWLVGGMVVVVAGLVLLSTIDEQTPIWLVGVHMLVLGVGLGATMQNLVLVVQNNTAPADMGAASSLVNFFRSIGGAAGVSAMGAVFAHHVTQVVTDGLVRQDIDPSALSTGGEIPAPSELPAPLRLLVEQAYGEAGGRVFWLAVPFAVIGLVCVLLLRETPLRESVLRDDHLDPEVAAELGIDQPGGVRP